MNQSHHSRTPAPASAPQVVIVLGGDLDIASAPDVRVRIGAAMGGRGATIVTDLSGVSFIDSSGLRELVAARARLVAGGQRVLVRSPSPAVRRLLAWLSEHDALGLPAESPTPRPATLHELPVSA